MTHTVRKYNRTRNGIKKLCYKNISLGYGVKSVCRKGRGIDIWCKDHPYKYVKCHKDCMDRPWCSSHLDVRKPHKKDLYGLMNAETAKKTPEDMDGEIRGDH